MPRGADSKREHEYEQLKDRFQEEGRYQGREEEVAARIVNKQRAEYGETREDKQQERQGTNADRSLPIEHYRTLKAPQVEKKAERLSSGQIAQVERFEKQHKNRKGVVASLDKARQRKKPAHKKAA